MTRASRETETRDETKRVEPWNPASTLPTPEKTPGWRFKWIRRLSLGETDVMNMSKSRREGWEPVPAEEQPSIADFSDTPGVIEVGGLVLCKMPEERAQARDQYYANMAKSQVDGLSRSFNNEAAPDSRMPIFEDRRTKVSRSPTDS